MSGPERIEAFVDAHLVRTWLVNHSNTFNPERVRCVGQYIRADLCEPAMTTKKLEVDYCLLKAQRDRLVEEAERLQHKVNASEGVLASVTDKLNSWCRECGVQEARGYLTLEVRDVLDAVWAKNSTYRAQRDRYAAALRKIEKAEGRFSTDHKQHAINTVEDMQGIARAALASVSKGPQGKEDRE